MVDAIQILLEPPNNGAQTVLIRLDGSQRTNEAITRAILPGSFSPLHKGHERLAYVAAELTGGPVVFEISVVNVDKPTLQERDVRERLTQFRGRWPVVLTRAPRFRDKAALFPGCTFVVGWDTASRLVSPEYYGGSQISMSEALKEIQEASCQFLVAGRVHDGIFRTLSDVAIPQDNIDMFQNIPETRFRADVSSSGIRSSSAK